MNTTILQKCVDELGKSEPDIRYVLGMLETFIELNKPSVAVLGAPLIPMRAVQVPEPLVGEDELDPRYVHGPIGKIA